jgi:hypothetical protein
MEEWALHELRMTLLIDQPFLVHDEIPAVLKADLWRNYSKRDFFPSFRVRHLFVDRTGYRRVVIAETLRACFFGGLCPGPSK